MYSLFYVSSCVELTRQGAGKGGKIDGTFPLWKWVQDRCEMSTISKQSPLPYITTPPQLLIARP